ncbi:MAG: hypothetical protein HKM91_09180 [Altererythrobacter sp.]|nr:hypothetical protein [Altererythrobacter sp.]
MSAVPPQLRVKALQDWRTATIERLEATIEQIARFEADGDILAAMATRGGELEERARIQWIDEMIERMSAR